MTATATDRHRALAACSPSALKVWHAIVALTADGQDCTLAAICGLTGLHERTATKARAELRRRHLLPSPEESASRARVARLLEGIDLTTATWRELVDIVLVACDEPPTTGSDRRHLGITVERFGADATIRGVIEALSVPGLGADRWRFARQVAARESRSRSA